MKYIVKSLTFISSSLTRSRVSSSNSVSFSMSSLDKKHTKKKMIKYVKQVGKTIELLWFIPRVIFLRDHTTMLACHQALLDYWTPETRIMISDQHLPWEILCSLFTTIWNIPSLRCAAHYHSFPERHNYPEPEPSYYFLCYWWHCNPKYPHRQIYSRFTKKRNDLRIHYRGGGRFWSYFWGKNRPIYMAFWSFLVLGGPLDTGSRSRVVNNWFWFPT